jgi:hypothetical protein
MGQNSNGGLSGEKLRKSPVLKILRSNSRTKLGPKERSQRPWERNYSVPGRREEGAAACVARSKFASHSTNRSKPPVGFAAHRPGELGQERFVEWLCDHHVVRLAPSAFGVGGWG